MKLLLETNVKPSLRELNSQLPKWRFHVLKWNFFFRLQCILSTIFHCRWYSYACVSSPRLHDASLAFELLFPRDSVKETIELIRARDIVRRDFLSSWFSQWSIGPLFLKVQYRSIYSYIEIFKGLRLLLKNIFIYIKIYLLY